MNNIDERRVACRVHGRETARTLIALADPDGLNEQSRESFWEFIRDEALKHAPLPAPEAKRPRLEPMNKAELMAFEDEPMPRGQYEGLPVWSVEDSDEAYLHWWVNHRDEFTEKLERYLATPHDSPEPDEEGEEVVE